MATVHIDWASALFDLLERTPDHIIPRRQIGHWVVPLHEPFSQGVDQVGTHTKKGIESRGAEPFRYDGQTDIFHVRQLYPCVEGRTVQVSGAGRAVPQVEGVARLGSEHPVGIAGGDNSCLSPNLVKITRANIEPGESCELPVVETEIGDLDPVQYLATEPSDLLGHLWLKPFSIEIDSVGAGLPHGLGPVKFSGRRISQGNPDAFYPFDSGF